MDHRIVPVDGEAFFTSNLTQAVDPLTEMGCDPDVVAIYGANCQMLPDGTRKLLTYSDWKYAYWTIKGQFGQSTLQADPNRTGPQI